MRLFRRSREERALPPGALALGSAPWPNFTSSGERITGDYALRHPAVWACVHLIAGTISSFPCDVFADDGSERTTPPVLQEPAAGMSLGDFIYAVVESLLLHGNCVGLVTARSGASLLPTQVELVAFPRVSLFLSPEDGTVTVHIGGKEFDYTTDVWHVAGYRTAGAVLGRSPVQNGAEAIGLGIAQMRFAAEYFDSGAGGIPVGVLKPSPGSQWASGGDEWDDTAAKLARQWREYRTRRTGVVVLNGVDYEPVEFDANAMQLTEAIVENTKLVARLFNVPVEMISGDSGRSLTYANVESRNLDFVRYTLGPWIRALEEGLSRLLPSNQRAKFNLDALLRATTKDRYDAHAVGIQSGFLTVDEARALEDLPPLAQQPSPTTNGKGKAAATEPLAVQS